MALLTSALIGAAIAAVLGMIGLIPLVNIISCLISPGLTLVGGYLVGSTSKLAKGAWMNLISEILVFSTAATVVGIIFAIINMVFNLGMSTIGGSDALSLGLSAGFGIISLAIGIILGFIYTFVLGLIGGAIYMFTKK